LYAVTGVQTCALPICTAERLKDQENRLKTAPAGGRRAATRFETAMAASTKPAAGAPTQPGNRPAAPTR